MLAGLQDWPRIEPIALKWALKQSVGHLACERREYRAKLVSASTTHVRQVAGFGGDDWGRKLLRVLLEKGSMSDTPEEERAEGDVDHGLGTSRRYS